MVTAAYKEAYALACEQGHPQGADLSVWPTLLRGGVPTTGMMLHPDHEWAGEICAEVGDAAYVELLELLRGRAA